MMVNFDGLDRLNIPIYVCNSEMAVVYRNKACKRYAKSPRVNGRFKILGLADIPADLPCGKDGVSLVSCYVDHTYKSALIFKYREWVVAAFPSVLEFDIISAGIFDILDDLSAKVFCKLIDSIKAEDYDNELWVKSAERARKHILSVLENNSMTMIFESSGRVTASFFDIYTFLQKRIKEILVQRGYKIAFDVEEDYYLTQNIYTDTIYFASVLTNLLLLCFEVSDSKRCEVHCEVMGTFVRNKISFKCSRNLGKCKSGDGLGVFAERFPIEYFNFLIYERFCDFLGWRISYSLYNDRDLNCSVYLDIDNDNSAILRSSRGESEYTCEEAVNAIVSMAFLI